MTNGEFKLELENRTVAFSVAVLRTLRKIPVGIESRNIKDQLVRSATAIGANYREANRAESRNDFLHKISVVAKEASESEYWLLLLKELYPNVAEISPVLIEAGELVRIFDSIIRPSCSWSPRFSLRKRLCFYSQSCYYKILTKGRVMLDKITNVLCIEHLHEKGLQL